MSHKILIHQSLYTHMTYFLRHRLLKATRCLFSFSFLAQSILSDLSQYLPGARCFPPCSKSKQTGRKAQPDILPNLVLKVNAPAEPGIKVMVSKCDARDLQGVNCGHFGVKPSKRLTQQQTEALSGKSSLNPYSLEASEDGLANSVGSRELSSNDLNRLSMSSSQRNKFAASAGVVLVSSSQRQVVARPSQESMTANPSNTSSASYPVTDFDSQRIRVWASLADESPIRDRFRSKAESVAAASSQNASRPGAEAEAAKGNKASAAKGSSSQPQSVSSKKRASKDRGSSSKSHKSK